MLRWSKGGYNNLYKSSFPGVSEDVWIIPRQFHFRIAEAIPVKVQNAHDGDHRCQEELPKEGIPSARDTAPPPKDHFLE
jgi:hypothetical protein